MRYGKNVARDRNTEAYSSSFTNSSLLNYGNLKKPSVNNIVY